VRSVIEGGHGTQDRLAGVVVVPDHCCQCEDPLEHAGDDAARGASAVSFQVELGFEGLVDRFDDLP
jgi:hypothetical protein